MNKFRYIADGYVYNVKEKMEESIDDEEFIKRFKPDHYEYTVWLVDTKTGETVDEWDSLDETYNEGQELSKNQAEKSLKEVLDDVNKEGKVTYWFYPNHWNKTSEQVKKENITNTKNKSSKKSIIVKSHK